MNDIPDHQGLPPITGGVPPGTRIDRFVVEETLGRGGTATVLVVRDPRGDRLAAMKLLHVMGDDERLRSRFRREFRALARLVHPNVLKVEEWGIHAGRPWFTMELVRGRVLRDAIADWAALPPDERFARVEDVLVQVTRALACIHERDLVHRDVTPGNVMIRDDGVVKLMDFGLVTDRGGELTSVGEIVGTVAHIAPEQLRGERLDARADLYALGTVLYQMLTGRKPFTAHTVQGWVERHLHERPRPPREHEPLVPELLDRVCMRLLEKDPKDRFASASHLLQVLGDPADAEVDDHWPPRFVGRTGAKAWIRATLDEIAAGRRGGALVLTGGSGSGKTRALDRAEREAERLGLRVARATCKADRPFGLIADLLEALEPATVPPLLRAAIRGDDHAPEERWPVLAAFREVVEAAAPCVILVDHLEQSDPVTRDTLEYLVRNTLELAEVPVAYLVACESEENLFGPPSKGGPGVFEPPSNGGPGVFEPPSNGGPGVFEPPSNGDVGAPSGSRHDLGVGSDAARRDGPPGEGRAAAAGYASTRAELLQPCGLAFSDLGAVERQHFGPLTEAEVEEIVTSVLPDHDLASALAHRVHAETDGRAAWVADMLRGLVDQGLVVREGRTWRLSCDAESLRASELPLPEKLRAALERRVAPLSEPALEVGRLLAIARSPVSLDALVEAAPLDEEQVMASVDELLDADVAVERRRLDDDTVELSHTRFRDVLLERETPESLAARHRLLGGALEHAHRYALADAVEALAWHFEQGGVAAKAYAYLAQTVAAYQQRGLFEEALVRADRALRMEPAARPHLPLDEADRRLAELRLARTRSLYHLGQWDEALAEGRATVAVAERVRSPDLLARTLTRLGYILRNSGQLPAARAALERAIAAADAAHDASLLPRPLYHLGAVAWAEGRFDAAEEAWTRSLALAQEGGLPRAEGMAHNGLGILLFCRGRSTEARAQLELAADIFREVGMVDYLAIAQVNLIELYLSTGLLRRAQVLVEKTVAQSMEVGHSHSTSLGLVWHARLQLVVGRPAEAARTAREALRSAEIIGSIEEQASSLATLVQARIALGEAAEALCDTEHLLGVLADADPEGLRPQVIAMHVQVLLARGEVRRAEIAVEDLQERPVAPHVAARRDVYLGRALSALGREASAVQRLDQALELARSLGYRWYELLALHELARIGPPDQRAACRSRAHSLARTLASGLAREDADAFLARGWGEPKAG